MFTGIIDHTGTIEKIELSQRTASISISCKFLELTEGESIAVDGVCLTVNKVYLTTLEDQTTATFSCDLSMETLAVTSANNWQCGTKINLERAIRLSDRMGGHWVTGHVDSTALVKEIKQSAKYISLFIHGVAPQHNSYIHSKGSIAINGVSLTINSVLHNGFEVMIIPHTLARTNLNLLQTGTIVNLEFDWMVKVLISEIQRSGICNIAKIAASPSVKELGNE